MWQKEVGEQWHLLLNLNMTDKFINIVREEMFLKKLKPADQVNQGFIITGLATYNFSFFLFTFWK